MAGLATLTVVFLLTFHALDGPRGGSVSTLKQQLARFSSTAGREGTPSAATVAAARGNAALAERASNAAEPLDLKMSAAL